MRSKELFEESRKVLVGGVNSPVRAISPYPFFTKRASGCKIEDSDGKSYVDYCLGYGPLILGHAHPAVVKAVSGQLEKGTLYGTPTELELDFAKKVVKHVPSAEMVRFLSTGTEATMAAVRLARGYTGKKKIIKFEGAFHGAHDYVLVKAGSGATTHGAPTSAGVPEETTGNTIVVPFNDRDAVRDALKGGDVACVIMEPVIGNAGCILPEEGFLEFLREETEKRDVMLVFDEVITGFRLGLGGAQERFGITPDITTLGKIAGGGLPIGIVAAGREVMENLSPLGKVYQAGTFNGNPLSMAAGYAAVGEIEKGSVLKKADSAAERLKMGLKDVCEGLGLETRIYGIASMFQMYFTGEDVRDYRSALRADKEKFLRFQRGLLEKGVFIPPSQYECNFCSCVHEAKDVEDTLMAAEMALRSLR